MSSTAITFSAGARGRNQLSQMQLVGQPKRAHPDGQASQLVAQATPLHQLPLDQALLLTLFQRPIAFHRSFVQITGSVTSALLLSHAVTLTKHVQGEPTPDFEMSAHQCTQATGLSRHEQDTARAGLKSLRLLSWRRARYGTVYTVNLDELLRCLTLQAQATSTQPLAATA